MESFTSGGVLASGVVLVVVSLAKIRSRHWDAVPSLPRWLHAKHLPHMAAAYELMVGLICIVFPLSLEAGSLLLFTGACFMWIQLLKRSGSQGCGCSGMNDWDPIGHTRAILRAGVVFLIGLCSCLVLSTSSQLQGRLTLWGIVWFLVDTTLYGLLSKRQIPRVIWARLIRRHWYIERVFKMDPFSQPFIEAEEHVSWVHLLSIDRYQAKLQCLTTRDSLPGVLAVVSIMGWRTKVSYIARLAAPKESILVRDATSPTGLEERI